MGCSPWGHWESGTTDRLHFHFSLSCIGVGNGNPLQYSCLENPRDRGAWWAAIYGVAQSRTQLKRLSSSSSNNEYSKREIKESIPFTIDIKRIKYLAINLPKETKGMYTEIYKTLMKEIKDDINRWKDIPCSWKGRTINVKMTILLNAIYTKLPMGFFTQLEQKNSQFIRKHKDPL